MSLVECRTAEEVRELARRMAERRKAQYVKPRPSPEPPPIIVAQSEPDDPLPVIEAIDPPEPPPLVVPTIRHIQNVVCAHFNIPLVVLLSKRTTFELRFPRMVAIWLAKQLTARTYWAIGHYFGGRDHSTIIHSVDRIESMRNIDPHVAELLAYFLNILQPSQAD